MNHTRFLFAALWLATLATAQTIRPAVVVDMAAFFASVGAFPLTGGESSFDYGSFAPGNYTIQVSDQSGQGGTVLVEVYEFSTSPAPPTPTPPVAPPGLGG